MVKHQLRLLRFALHYRHENNWHSYGTDSATVQAIDRLADMGLFQVNKHRRQFRLVDSIHTPDSST